VGVASAYFAATVLLDDRGARAQGVEVSGADGVVIDQGVTPREALKIASDKLGYEVKGLGFTPGSGFQLQRIVLSRRIYDYSPREAMLDYTSPDPTADHGALRIAVIQTDRPDTHPANWQPKDDPNRPFDIGVPGVEAWVSGDQLRRVYSLNVGQRSFTVVIDQRQPPDDDVRRMIRELID
jgi:hypothetical protein